MSAYATDDTTRARALLLPGLQFVPLALLQPILNKIGNGFAKSRPEFFVRLGEHSTKCFVIDPVDLPFVLALWPRQDAPRLKAFRRHHTPRHDARIGGTFLDLFDMIDGQLDGDALFFSRELDVRGDTEAIVALRNALDDVEGGAVNGVAAAFGPFSGAAMRAIALLRTLRRTKPHGFSHG